MNKRKTRPDNTAATSKVARPKKRVAVSVRKNAATKAIIARNATTSPLLTLPTEIREQIWMQVLGNSLIHIDYQNFDELSFKDNEARNPRPWRHLVCQEDCKEDRPDVKHTHEMEHETLICYSRAHDGCEPDYDVPDSDGPIDFTDHETMRLTVLCVCNQIYTEAARVLWTSNTFSFRDGGALRRFLMTRSIKQKPMIRSLRLEMGWWTQDFEDWEKAITMQALKSLPGLRHLRLHITQKMEAEIYRRIKGEFLDYTTWGESMRRLATLPLKSVEVHVRLPWTQRRSNIWTERDMKEVADMLRELLLSPEGAELYAEHLRHLEETKERFRKWRERAAVG